jgi:hypothetical protein
LKEFAVIALFLAAALAFSQGPDGAIVGTVRDVHGARIPGAAISAEASAFTLVRTATANEEGEFRLPALPPGEYRMRLQAAGFEPQTLTVHVAVAGSPTVDVIMKPAGTREAVTVPGSTSSVTEQALETTSSVVQSVVGRRDLADIPLARRSRWNLLIRPRRASLQSPSAAVRA